MTISSPAGAPCQALDPRPGLGGDQAPGGEVPRLQPPLVVAVDPAAGHVAQVERGRAQPPDVAHLRQQPAHDLGLLARRSWGVAEAGGDQGADGLGGAAITSRAGSPPRASGAPRRAPRRTFAQDRDRRPRRPPSTPSSSAATLTAQSGRP